MSDSTRSRRQSGGRQPSGPNGEPRTKFVAFKLAPSEEKRLHELLQQRGLKPSGEGMRDLLVTLAAEDYQQAA